MPKVALVTGCTGQDGSYLAELLLEKGYHVHGLVRRVSQDTTANIRGILSHERFVLHYGDLTDSNTLYTIIKQTRPDEIYNLAAQSHVRVSFDVPVNTGDINALGPARILEAMRSLNMINTSKFYQASTSEMFGKVHEIPQNEETPFHPRSPYGVSKLYAHWIVKNYRESYNLFGCNGILFNHESPRRGESFVTRKITKAVANIHNGLQTKVTLGNLDAERDWGHAKDYVRGMWLMLQQREADDYILATGQKTSVRKFIEIAFKYIDIDIIWDGSGTDEVGYNSKTNKVVVDIDPKYYRPAEVDMLLGDPAKAQAKLNWVPDYSFEMLVQDMMENDLKI